MAAYFNPLTGVAITFAGYNCDYFKNYEGNSKKEVKKICKKNMCL